MLILIALIPYMETWDRSTKYKNDETMVLVGSYSEINKIDVLEVLKHLELLSVIGQICYECTTGNSGPDGSEDGVVYKIYDTNLNEYSNDEPIFSGNTWEFYEYIHKKKVDYYILWNLIELNDSDDDSD